MNCTVQLQEKDSELIVSKRTVQQTVAEDLHYTVSRPIAAPFLRPVHIERRLKWAMLHRHDN